jgi:hypothetical protein
MTKTLTIPKDQLEALLQTNVKAVERALTILLANQTADEVSSHTTKHINGKGFSGAEGEFLTAMALRVRAGQPLSPRMLQALRKKNAKGYSVLAKYHGQFPLRPVSPALVAAPPAPTHYPAPIEKASYRPAPVASDDRAWVGMSARSAGWGNDVPDDYPLFE